MKKLGIALCLVVAFGAPAQGLPVHSKVYKNCTELNKVYPGGVAKNSKVSNVGGKTKYKPTVNAKIYEANKSKDRDKDGIACEK